jgi:quinoprotein glucose dehydrogenase
MLLLKHRLCDGDAKRHHPPLSLLYTSSRHGNLTLEMKIATVSLLFACVLLSFGSTAKPQSTQDAVWPTYGGDLGGQRFSSAAQITRENVKRLHQIWTFHTKALESGRPGTLSAAFESTPVLFHKTLYLTSPFDQVFALDPLKGTQRWTYDPSIPTVDLNEGQLITSRGVATWDDTMSLNLSERCHSRIFLGTLIGILVALDADTGKPCTDFGNNGRVDLKVGVQYKKGDTYEITSAPTVLGDVVVVGSSISDNAAVDMEMGSVRGFDVRSGKQLWSWDPIPWALQQKVRTGAANSWSTISADPVLGLLYIPTGSASPDYYGGMRLGDNRDADSVVAIEAATGKKIWAFQVVHHNLWDYDVASEPLLFTFHDNIPAVAITTKMGMVFVLDRRTGKPLYPVEERSVPQSDVPGEHVSPTQPFSALPPLSLLTLPTTEEDSSIRSPENRQFCREQIAALRYDGIYTPPSVRGTMVFPGNIGGVNWGSPALDPRTGIMYANTNHLAFAIHLIDKPAKDGTPLYLQRKKWVVLAIFAVILGCGLRRSWNPGRIGLIGVLFSLGAIGYLTHLRKVEIPANIEAAFGRGISPQHKTPYQLIREPIVDHDHNPCLAPPWGSLTAINLNTGQKLWDIALGTMQSGKTTGSLNLGGPIVTAGGLIFTAGTREPFIRAFDEDTGEELWKSALPVPAQATPMTFSIGGRQLLLIASGGHGTFRTKQGDALIAFALD